MFIMLSFCVQLNIIFFSVIDKDIFREEKGKVFFFPPLSRHATMWKKQPVK